MKSIEGIESYYDLSGNLFENNHAMSGGVMFADSIKSLHLTRNTFLKN